MKLRWFKTAYELSRLRTWKWLVPLYLKSMGVILGDDLTFYKIINFRTQKFAFLPFALSDPSHLFLGDRRFLILPRC